VRNKDEGPGSYKLNKHQLTNDKQTKPDDGIPGHAVKQCAVNVMMASLVTQ